MHTTKQFLWGVILLLASTLAMAEGNKVSGQWLEQRLGDPNLVILDMSSDANQYQRFHLPGAIQFANQYLMQMRQDGVMMQIPQQRLVQLLGILGISRDTQVVLYDDIGGLQAGRMLWALEQIGHQKVAVLDGGLVRWVLDGRKVVNTPVEPKPVSYRLEGEGKENGITADQLKALLDDGKTRLVDVRTDQEYTGSPKDPRSGHIPGAVWWPWQQGVDFEGGFVMADRDKLLASLASVGVTPDQPVVLYCRTGHRASQAYYTLKELGFKDLRMYDGSMQEWSKRSDLPLKQGMQP